MCKERVCASMVLYAILTFRTLGSGGGVGCGVCGLNICYHVAAFVVPSNLICNMTMF